MAVRRIAAVLLLTASLAFAQECPEIPENDVDFGAAVGPFPEDVPGGCSDFEVLVARGTSEPNFAPDGKFGVIVGDPLISNLTARVPGARGYPVQYPASASIISSGLAGRLDVVNRLNTQSVRCPNQHFALVGYSQGADVVHRAAERLSSRLYPKILAIAMFGDPNVRGSLLSTPFPAALQGKVLQSCADRDPTCSPTGDCTYFHLTYVRPVWIDRAVNFIVAAFQGSPFPPSTTVGLPAAAATAV